MEQIQLKFGEWQEKLAIPRTEQPTIQRSDVLDDLEAFTAHMHTFALKRFGGRECSFFEQTVLCLSYSIGMMQICGLTDDKMRAFFEQFLASENMIVIPEEYRSPAA